MELPVCLLGPGGDYVYPWPDESAPESVDFATETLHGEGDPDAHPVDPAARAPGSRRASSNRSRKRR